MSLLDLATDPNIYELAELEQSIRIFQEKLKQYDFKGIYGIFLPAVRLRISNITDPFIYEFPLVFSISVPGITHLQSGTYQVDVRNKTAEFIDNFDRQPSSMVTITKYITKDIILKQDWNFVHRIIEKGFQELFEHEFDECFTYQGQPVNNPHGD